MMETNRAEETLTEIKRRLDLFEQACRIVRDWDPETRPHAALAKALQDFIKERHPEYDHDR